MHLFLVSAWLCSLSFISIAQPGDSVIAELRTINTSVVNKSCTAGNAAAISNRAMNVFLADKTGYLSESSDLSLYTNYVTLNTTEGSLTVNHNFQKATGIDEPIKKLFSVGISVDVANETAVPFFDKKGENELALTMSHKWLGKVKTRFADCALPNNGIGQKQMMDALRAALLQTLILEMNKKISEFNVSVEEIDTDAIPGQDMDSAKRLMLRHFYKVIKEEYVGKFAKQQAEMLTLSNNFKTIRTNWTSLNCYVPIISPVYNVAASLFTSFQKRHAYPLEIMLSHTRFRESTTTGRWFITLAGTARLYNSKTAYMLTKMNASRYQTLGGTDTLHFNDVRNDKAYIGQYQQFLTPSLKGRLVYFPPNAAHVGISLAVEQHFGRFHLLNGKIGVPVVLINSKKLPAANFEFYVQFFDITNHIEPAKSMGSTTIVGLQVGIPFSRLMF